MPLLQLAPLVAFVWFFAPFSDLFGRAAPDWFSDSPLAWVLAVFLGVLPMILVVSLWLRPHVGHTIVTVSPTQGIQVAERLLYRTRVIASISADCILDVDFSTDQSARTKRPTAEPTNVVLLPFAVGQYVR